VAIAVENATASPRRLCDANPAVPKKVEDAVHSALARELDRRCPSVGVLLACILDAWPTTPASAADVARYVRDVAGDKLERRRERIAEVVRAAPPDGEREPAQEPMPARAARAADAPPETAEPVSPARAASSAVLPRAPRSRRWLLVAGALVGLAAAAVAGARIVARRAPAAATAAASEAQASEPSAAAQPSSAAPANDDDPAATSSSASPRKPVERASRPAPRPRAQPGIGPSPRPTASNPYR
jgi:hypothetical protein